MRPSEMSGRRESRVHAAPAALRAEQKKAHAGHHRYAEITPALPAHGFTAYSALLCRGDGTTQLGRTRPFAIVSQAHASTAPRLTCRDDWPNVPLYEAR